MGLQNKDEHNIILRSKIVFLHEFKQAIFTAIAKKVKNHKKKCCPAKKRFNNKNTPRILS